MKLNETKDTHREVSLWVQFPDDRQLFVSKTRERRNFSTRRTLPRLNRESYPGEGYIPPPSKPIPTNDDGRVGSAASPTRPLTLRVIQLATLLGAQKVNRLFKDTIPTRDNRILFFHFFPRMLLPGTLDIRDHYFHGKVELSGDALAVHTLHTPTHRPRRP